MAAPPTKIDPIEESLEKILLGLRNISHISSVFSKHLQKHLKITSAQLLFLRVLNSNDGLSIGEIGKRIFIKPGTITGIVDRLENKGFVSRIRASTDRRVVNVAITEAGKQLVDAAPTPIQSRLAINLRKLTPDELENITSTLQRLIDLMQTEETATEISLASSETEVF